MKSAMLKIKSNVESNTLRMASPRSIVVRLLERDVYTKPEAAIARGPVIRGYGKCKGGLEIRYFSMDVPRRRKMSWTSVFDGNSRVKN